MKNNYIGELVLSQQQIKEGVSIVAKKLNERKNRTPISLHINHE
ncbi:hypothetical protein [Photobacterium piscicola]|uniref:Uncharacterized protein n=1 Tax=Photobacterium piscicola TaxID=1378299 RepID=A0ABU6LGR2_9GAMM|nr:hypothetical protein [Photobacterium piscicola]